MISNKQLLSQLTDWIKKVNPKQFKLVWVDFDIDLSFNFKDKGYDPFGTKQSNILKYICEKNNISYEVYKSTPVNTDKDRILELSNLLIWKSEKQNIILVSKTLKEQLYFGEYQKYYFDILDISPFGGITQSQIDNLIHFIETDEDLVRVSVYSKLEWLYHEDKMYKIIFSENDPTKHPRWGIYSLEQRSWIARFYAIVKNRMHKIEKNNIFNG